jgi:hypothetical protein
MNKLAFDDPIDFVALAAILVVLYFGFVKKSKENPPRSSGARSTGYIFLVLGLFSFVFLSVFTLMFIIVGLLLIFLSRGSKRAQLLES